MSFPTFSEFFHDLYGLEPFPWQEALAAQAVAGTWPAFISAPTGSGKTACLDIAVYALAAQANRPPAERSASRRIFFIVNRRVIVDEAFRRGLCMAETLCDALKSEDKSACRSVAEALLSLNPLPKGFPRLPLACVQLRGAIYRDQRWARSLLQPTIVTSTVDQIGSRLLFRGYGVSPAQRPIHAALVATDAMWLLDEAHISRPFAETVEAIRSYRKHHGEQHPNAVTLPPFHWVQLTATPPNDPGAPMPFRLTEADSNHSILEARLSASKPAQLILAKAPASKAKVAEALRDALIEQVEDALTQEEQPRSIAVMVNRVATARDIAKALTHKTQAKYAPLHANVTLLIGRMRPHDREHITPQIQEALKRAARREAVAEGETPPPVEIVVATQCLEVGADFDFDALITECASLDALRQRFGRLNRQGRAINAWAAIVMPQPLLEADEAKLDGLADDDKSLDPIYGKALPATWNWLQTQAEGNIVDFGLNAMSARVDQLPQEALARLQAPTSQAPVLFPAYLDAWSQTNPAPWPDPDPALFLHGRQTSQPDVLVCWRADLTVEDSPEVMTHTVSLCPPSQTEALPVPLYLFKQWFFPGKGTLRDDTGDLFATLSQEDEIPEKEHAPRSAGLLWKGIRESELLNASGQLYPGAVIVLPASAGGWNSLGHIPNVPSDPASSTTEGNPQLARIDVAEAAFQRKHARPILRIHKGLSLPEGKSEAWNALKNWAFDPDYDLKIGEIRNLCTEAANDEALPPELKTTLGHLGKAQSLASFVRYQNGAGAVLTTSRRISEETSSVSFVPQAEDDADDLSRNRNDAPVTLREHSGHVVSLVENSLYALGLADLAEAVIAAARLHDWGKLDPRFQALLLDGKSYAVYALPESWAKSGQYPASAQAYETARAKSGLPKGFRHEMASVELASQSTASACLPEAESQRALALHLIAAHHGHARPFAPVIMDDDPPPLSTQRLPGATVIAVDSETRKAQPPHRLDSGIAERFWELTRLHGWWGLAYMESLLRLADQQASEAENEDWYTTPQLQD